MGGAKGNCMDKISYNILNNQIKYDIVIFKTSRRSTERSYGEITAVTTGEVDGHLRTNRILMYII
jgi:hypothetical protein